ncbi:hypothetical protein [Chitinophaga filiformis]|uniref:DUF4468 domain-containing protein n=1 Tax=Chitinophaga filiformis TaxID=104663 RepID=A0ABY4I9G6_CHIFI|nr:hypothetical protein [Chitinophaga filiformis]UPK71411.1 hypothetical protein MYF79_08990 [Chitinophaga filiformis]
MRRILSFLLLLNLQAFAQTDNALQHIKERYQEVNKNISSYRMARVDLPDISTEGADLEGYFTGDTLQLMVHTIYGEMGKMRLEVYYEKGAPVFYYDRDYKYEVPMYDSTFEQHKMAVKEYRGYFYKGKMIRLIDEKNLIFTKRDEEFIKTEQEYLKSAADLYKIIFAHRSSGVSRE